MALTALTDRNKDSLFINNNLSTSLGPGCYNPSKEMKSLEKRIRSVKPPPFGSGMSNVG